MHAGLKLKHACYAAAIKLLGLHDLQCSSIALLKCQNPLFLCIFKKVKLYFTSQHLIFSVYGQVKFILAYNFCVTDKADEIVPVSKPSRIPENAVVDSRVATIKQRPSSRCFPSATDMNVSGVYNKFPLNYGGFNSVRIFSPNS